MEIVKSKKAILVVEDDLPVLKALTDKLTREGFEIIQAKDGEEGLALAEQERPDLIVLDIIMPKMSGIAMMKKLRESGDWGKNVPIILLTNLSRDDQEVSQSIAEDKNSYYMLKTDWSINDVVDKVKEKLG